MLTAQLSFGQTKKLNAESSIQNVTIFSSGARVERAAGVNIQVGRSEIAFAGLSNQLELQTVQLKADADIVLLSVQTTRDFVSGRKVEQQERAFIDQMSELQDKLDLDNKLLAVLKNEEDMLVKNQSIGGQGGVKTPDLKEALEFQRQRLTELYNKQLEIQKRIAREKQDWAASNEQLKEISRKKDSISYVVTALVESKTPRSVNFKLLYNIKDAGWYPTYDVRVTDITAPLSVRMNANVFQRSGESWKNIPLQLSTGNPTDNSTPSQLSPWMLGFYDPSVPARYQGAQNEVMGRVVNERGEPMAGASIMVKAMSKGTVSDNNGYFKLSNITKNTVLSINYVGYQSKIIVVNGGYVSISMQPSAASLDEVVVIGYGTTNAGSVADADVERQRKKMETMRTVTMATQYQPTATIYRIDDHYTLESDGKTTAIGIKEVDIPASYDYISVPKVDPTAFLTARVVNWQDYELQSGEASLYYEGTFLGKTYIDLASTADTLSLSLGRDNAIRITRKLLKEYSSKKFIGSNRTDTRQYEIAIRNTKKTAVNITLLDQVPVSVTKEISVDDVKVSDAQMDKETGNVSWTLALPSGQEKKLGISYSVKYPKDRKLVLE